MTPAFRVVVVGGGVIGASIAYQLARREVAVTLLERASGPAEGSTGASSSISRCRYTHPEMVQLALDGQTAYRAWADFTGESAPAAGYHRVGVLWLFDEPAQSVEREVDRMREYGVAAEALDVPALKDRYPSLSACVAALDLASETEHACRNLDLALYESNGGYVDPAAACTDLLEAARRHGADVQFGARVAGFVWSGERVTGVKVAGRDAVHADLAINAAGPWCNELNAEAGVEHGWDLDPTRVQVGYRDLPPEVGPLPVVADGSTGIYFRPDSGGARLIYGSVLAEDELESADPNAYPRHADAAFRDLKVHGVHHRIPSLEHRGRLSGLSGLYTINRVDVHPVVGPSGIDGVWLANGFSGHGFKLAPMIGSMIARNLTGIPASFDTEVPLDLFAIGRAPIEVAAKNVLA